MVSRTCGSASWWVHPQLEDELLAEHGLRLQEWQHQGRVEVVKSGPHRTVYRLTLSAGRFYLKHYKVPDWPTVLQNIVRHCKAKREWMAATRAAALGIDTISPVAVGWIKVGPCVTESWLITRDIENTETVHDFVLQSVAWAEPTERPAPPREDPSPAAVPQIRVPGSPAVRQQLAVGLGDLAGRLHRGGLLHRDFHAGNLLIRWDPGGSARFWLIDLHAMSFRCRLTRRHIERNLALLSHFFSGRSTRSDRLRFFRSYWKALAGSRVGRAHHSEPPISTRRWAKPTRRRSDNDYRRMARRVEAYCQGSLLRQVRRGDRKWLRENRRLIIADAGDRRCRGLAWLGRNTILQIRDDPERLFDEGIVRSWFRRSGRVRRARIELPIGSRSVPCVATAIQTGSASTRSWWPDRWADRDRKSDVRRCWEAGHAFLRRGIPCPQPLLFVEAASGSPARQYLLTEDIPGSISLSESLRTEFGRRSELERDERLGRVTNRLAAQIRTMHEFGFEHRRFFAENVWVSEDLSDSRLWFGELNAVRSRRRIRKKQIVRQMAQLTAGLSSIHGIRHTHHLRFLKAYLGKRYAEEWKHWWREIETHVRGLSKVEREDRASAA